MSVISEADARVSSHHEASPGHESVRCGFTTDPDHTMRSRGPVAAPRWRVDLERSGVLRKKPRLRVEQLQV